LNELINDDTFSLLGVTIEGKKLAYTLSIGANVESDCEFFMFSEG
jgi:hypothetical protein